jgi:hypothetical protein
MVRWCATIVCVSLLASCVSAPVELNTPALLRGTVSHPHYTGWARDWCWSGRPARSDDLHVTEDCLSHGGEIYSATLDHWGTIDGSRSGRAIRVGFVGHALPKRYRQQHYLILQRLPADLREQMGLDYIVAEYDNYDARQSCVVERGYAHVDFRDCPDEAFHQQHEGKCVPLAEFLAHYAAAADGT